MKKTLHYIALIPFLIWMILLIIVPLFLVAYYGFTEDGNFSLTHFQQFFRPDYLKVLWRSLYLALVSTVVCLFIGYPVSMILSGKTFRKKTLLVVLLIAPMWMNFLLRTYAWLTLLEGNGIINALLQVIGLPKQIFLGKAGTVVFGMVYNFLPYMIFPIYTSISKIPRNLIEAAHDLGGNGVTCFFRIILPLSVPGILSGVTMVFVPGVTTFVISQYLGSGKITLIGDIIEQQFLHAGNWGFGAAISIIVMLVVVLCMWIVNRFSDDPGVMMP
ncbi:MAG: ABC transporter permease [Clostridia bacterium]|nr:ABC transporter permease [Clostridia bacterium]